MHRLHCSAEDLSSRQERAATKEEAPLEGIQQRNVSGACLRLGSSGTALHRPDDQSHSASGGCIPGASTRDACLDIKAVAGGTARIVGFSLGPSSALSGVCNDDKAHSRIRTNRLVRRSESPTESQAKERRKAGATWEHTPDRSAFLLGCDSRMPLSVLFFRFRHPPFAGRRLFDRFRPHDVA